MMSDDEPTNPCIQVLSPDRPLVPILNASGSVLATDLLAALRGSQQSYLLQLESDEDFKDADSILAAIKLLPDALDRFSTFNTWQGNPLFGIEPDDLQVILRAHRFKRPRWLREDVDVDVRPMLVRENSNLSWPAVAIGLSNPATHLAFLCALYKRDAFAEVILHGEDVVETNIFLRASQNVFLFGCKSNPLSVSNRFPLKSFEDAAKTRQPVEVLIPSNLPNYRKMLPKRLGGSLGEDLLRNECVVVRGGVSVSRSTRDERKFAENVDWVRTVQAA